MGLGHSSSTQILPCKEQKLARAVAANTGKHDLDLHVNLVTWSLQNYIHY